MYFLWPSWNKTAILPIGRILVPFAALGMISEGKRLSTCTPRWLRISFPAAEISAPESGKTSVSMDPLREEMWMGIVGAGSVTITCLIFGMWIWGSPTGLGGLTKIALAEAWGCLAGRGLKRRACLPWHTLAKCPVFWHE